MNLMNAYITSKATREKHVLPKEIEIMYFERYRHEPIKRWLKTIRKS